MEKQKATHQAMNERVKIMRHYLKSGVGAQTEFGKKFPLHGDPQAREAGDQSSPP